MIIGSSRLNFYVCAEDTEDFNALSCDPDSQQCEFRAGYLKISIRNSLLIANTIIGSEGERKKKNMIPVLNCGSYMTYKESANFCASSENWGGHSGNYFFRGV